MAEIDRADAGPPARTRRCAGRLRLAGLLLLAGSVAACTTGSVLTLQPAVDVGAQTAAVPAPAAITPPAIVPPAETGLETLVPANPTMVSYPRVEAPEIQPDVLPTEEVACRRELKKLGVQFTEIAPINAGGACVIEHPVKISSIGSVQLKPSATVTCAMARTFANWTKNELVPSARLRYLSGVKTIYQGSSYSCRNIRGSRTASEHSKGNAIDVMKIELNNDKDITVKKPGLFAFRQRSLLNNVRADACGYFSTVLGPGYDADHKDHFHFDIKERRNNYVACR